MGLLPPTDEITRRRLVGCRFGWSHVLQAVVWNANHVLRGLFRPWDGTAALTKAIRLPATNQERMYSFIPRVCVCVCACVCVCLMVRHLFWTLERDPDPIIT